MIFAHYHQVLLYIQQSISLAGVLVILSGVLFALFHYFRYLLPGHRPNTANRINGIRLNLGRILVLGLEFIVGADLIGTTTAPDYYSIGIVGCIVLIRTALNYTLSKEIASLSGQVETINAR